MSARKVLLSGRSEAAVPRWLADARIAADQPPRSPRAELRLSGAGPRIGSIDPALAERISAAGLPLRPSGAGWAVEGAVDRSLATIAGWLMRQPLGLRWRDELLPVVDGDGRTLGKVERGVVRVLGLRTFAVHLSGRTAEGRFWVQQRAFDKATDPGRWDTLMGGQMAAGESIEATLERETAEEAGLTLADLGVLERGPDVTVRRPVAEGWIDERIAVFRAVLDAATAPSNCDGEVIRFACPGEAMLRRRLAKGEFTLEATLILGEELESASRPSR
ncbi:MAG: NUDIX domain-containing protein [Caldimonas sp.]